MSTTSPPMATDIQTESYLRQRLEPRPGDKFYLHLSDLRRSIERVRSQAQLIVLDYGSGGSPYRPLFPNADYRRADFRQSDTDRLDYTLDEHSRVREDAETFDLILSTQVAEHVTDSALYFAECYRLLKPGGLLYCTTHGTFIDHGVPYDFQRWTADGLRRDLAKAGFTIVRLEKHTTGPRALLFQVDLLLDLLHASRKSLFGVALWLVRRLMTRFRGYVHIQCDKHYEHCRVVADQLDRHQLYIGLAALARKPEQGVPPGDGIR